MTQKQTAFLQAMLHCSTIKKAAELAGISVNTATKYLQDPEFQEELSRLRCECLNDTVRYLQSKLTLCSEQLVKIIEKPDTSDQVKINAINAVFSNCKAITETAEVISRLEQIERAMKENEL